MQDVLFSIFIGLGTCYPVVETCDTGAIAPVGVEASLFRNNGHEVLTSYVHYSRPGDGEHKLSGDRGDRGHEYASIIYKYTFGDKR